MLSSDLSTMGLADVLQWVDGTRGSGVLTIERPSGPIWLRVADRQLSACAHPEARGVIPARLATRVEPGRLVLDPQALAFEMLCDQFLDSNDRFRFEPGNEPPAPGIALDVAIQELVMTGMQYLDEWNQLRALYPSGLAAMTRIEGPAPAGLSSPQQALLVLAEQSTTLNEARLCLGLSQPALLRNVETLRRLGCVGVDGTPQGVDLTERLIRNTLLLLREKQFDEATHVLAALLSTEPGSKRIRELLRVVQSQHVVELYAAVPARARVRRRRRLPALQARLTPTERTVVELLHERSDVASLVLASPLREVETLKALRKLHRMEGIELRLPGDSRPVAAAPE